MTADVVQNLMQTLKHRVEGDELQVPSAPRYGKADDISWAAIGFAVHGEEADLVSVLRNKLVELQLPDGAIPLAPFVPQAWWPTSLSLLAWSKLQAFAESRKQAVNFLLQHRGLIFDKQADIVGHDTTLKGWPWIAGTHSWVEPTALVLLALFSEGLGDHPAAREGVAVLKDRILPSGGWNDGNTKVYGKTLLPAPESTGIALCAIHSELSATELHKSVAYLEKEYRSIRTPLGLSWTIMGLSACGICPGDAEAKVVESLGLQDRYGPFETRLIAQLAVCLSDFPAQIMGEAQ